MARLVAFLSGAPRTSTKRTASLTGGRQHILGTVKGFESNGWEVATYIVGDKVPEKWLRPDYAMDKGKSFATRLAADALRILLSAVHVTRVLREIRSPDWIYERHAAYQVFGYFFQRRGTPWILESNDALFNQAVSELRHVAIPSLMKAIEAFAYRKCDILVVISEELKNIIVEGLQIPAEKILVVPNAADTDTFDPDVVVPKRLFSEETFVLGFQGAMYKRHGLEYLLRAVARLRESGVNAAAVLLGDGHERRNLEQLAGELGIAQYVRFPGLVARAEVPAYIAGYDVCYSGQIRWVAGKMLDSPLKLYDYMAMAKPVVASRFPDAVKLTRDGEIGYLFAPGNVEDLVSALMRAYADRGSLHDIGAAGRAEILAHHTWSHRMHAFIADAERLLGAARSRKAMAKVGPVRDEQNRQVELSLRSGRD